MKRIFSLALLLALAPALAWAVHLNLTNSQSAYTDGFPASPSLSCDGSQAYVVYQITATGPGQVAAQLWSNLQELSCLEIPPMGIM